MTKETLEKKLCEMINNSEMIINREQFRTLYFVYDEKKVRREKLLKLNDSNYLTNTHREFSECDFFMSFKCFESHLLVKTNKDIFDNLSLVCNNNYSDIINFLNNFFCINYNLSLNERNLYVNYYLDQDIHLDEMKFAKQIDYNDLNENKTLVFSFAKYKFDICNYSYKQIANIFKKNSTKKRNCQILKIKTNL